MRDFYLISTVATAFILLSVLIDKLGTAAEAEFCAASNGGRITQCQKQCREYCYDVELYRKFLTQCDGIISIPKESLRDSDDCREAQPPSCERFQLSGGPSEIPELKVNAPRPACFNTFNYLRCRFEVPANVALKLHGEYSPILDGKYSKIKDRRSLCRVGKERLVKGYTSAQRLEPNVGRLSKEFEKESDCLEAVRTWLNGYNCAEIDNCSQLIESLVKRTLEEESKLLLSKRGQLTELVTQVEEEESAIRQIYSLHRSFCSQAPLD